MADEIVAASYSRRELVRYLLGICLGIVILALLAGKRGELVSVWRQLSRIDPGWVAAAIAAEGLSLWLFGFLQHQVLALAGVRIRIRGLFLLSLANDAIANSVPGEPAVSSAYRYRYYRRNGAAGAGAGWTIFTILIAQAIGMALLLLIGVLIALAASSGTRNTSVAIVGLVIVVAAGAVLVRRDLLLRLASALVRAARRVTGHPRGSVGARIETTLTRMREIPLGPASAAGVVALAAAVWTADFGCLLFSFRAVHAPIPWGGVLLAYGVAQVAGSLPVIPGGLGIVEGSLAVVLAAYGAGRGQALAAALAFRMVSFWLAIAIGWIGFGVLGCRARRTAPGHDDR